MASEEKIVPLPPSEVVKQQWRIEWRRRFENLRHALRSIPARVRAWRVRSRDARKLTREEIEKLFPQADKCGHCGGWHQIACPKVKRIKFASGSNSIEEVEFWPWTMDSRGHVQASWPTDQIIWPWQLADRIKEEPEKK